MKPVLLNSSRVAQSCRLPIALLRRAPLLVALVSVAGLGLAPSAFAQTLKPSAQLGASKAAAASPTASADGLSRSADFIVAIVDSEPITNTEVRGRLVRLEQQLTRDGGALPPREVLAKQVLERLISERSQLQLARDTGMKADESAIEFAIAGVARQNQLSVEDFRKRVEADGINWSTFRDDMRDELMLTRLRERDVEARVRVGETEIDDFIRANNDLSDPAKMVLNLAQILIPLPDSPSAAQVAQAKTRAQAAYERARVSGANFAQLASELSTGAEKERGGELGVREAERYPELFVTAVQALGVGSVAPPLQSGAGFHVLKVIEKRSAGMPSMAVTQTRARHILLRTGPQVSESAAVTRLSEMRRRVSTGATEFAVLARENSQDGSAQQGGDLGWVNPGNFVPEFEDVMNSLAPGELSQPVTSRFGVHLIQVVERRQTSLGDKEQRELVRGTVRSKKMEEQYANWAQEVRGKAFVEYREPPLAQ